MEIKINTSNESCRTDLQYVLERVSKEKLFNKEHNLRHPIGIYNVSVARLLNAFASFLDEYENSKVDTTLMECHKELIEAYLSFFDDMYLIMKCFHSKESVIRPPHFADKWLEKIDPNGMKRLKESINLYRNQYAMINNSIKHNHARYCHIKVRSSFGTVHGYYIESVDSLGSIIPNPEIHPEYKGMHTATSYNYDIRAIMFSWLMVCDIFKSEFELIIKDKSISMETAPILELVENHDLFNILNRIIRMRELYFPDEYEKNIARFLVHENCIAGTCPVSRRTVLNMLKPNGYKIEVQMSGDAITTSWGVPYLGN